MWKSLDNVWAVIHSSRLINLFGGRGKLWSGGWGNADHFQRLVELQETRASGRVGSLYNSHAAIQWTGKSNLAGGCCLFEGQFPSPVQDDTLPSASKLAKIHLIAPPSLATSIEKGSISGRGVPCWVFLAGTGDQGMAMRRSISLPLIQNEKHAVVILESPFYGSRRPPWQKGPKLRTVCDLLSLGNATIEEAIALLKWLQSSGFGSLGVCGFSMGGVHAMMTASVLDMDIALVSLLAPRCASHVFTEGALSRAVDWDVLQKEPPLVKQKPREEPHTWMSTSVGYAGAKEWAQGELGTAQPLDEARQNMKDLLRVTDVTVLQPPRAPAASILVQAEHDGYVSKDSGQEVIKAWGGGQLRWVPGGHVSAFFMQHAPFREAMRDSMAMMMMVQGNVQER